MTASKPYSVLLLYPDYLSDGPAIGVKLEQHLFKACFG